MSDLTQKNSSENVVRMIRNFEDKTNILTKQFFSNKAQTDLSDLQNFRYRNVVVESSRQIVEDEIRQVIKRYKSNNASDSNDIFNRVLKILIEKLLLALTSLFRVCVEQNYHSLCFRKTNIIALKKLNKSNYIDSKTYWLITLLNTMSKTFESIIARRINTFAKTHKMLFVTQMKKRRKRACETTLELFTKQIHTIWNMSKNKMTILLSMNVANACDHVSRDKFLHNSGKRNIFDWIIPWTNNFMMNKHTIFIINNQTTFMRRIKIDISQSSSISLILYLFYNANILEFLKRTRHRITIIDFVNDINILTYEISIENNCKALEKAYVAYELWARRHKGRFASTKYELLHFARNHRKFNMSTFINLNNVIKESSISMKMMRIQINITLK
jgi:hypothetical protein